MTTAAAAAPMTYVAFLRGINVGRAKPVAMAELREMAESLGFEDVRTLLRSGNVVFRAPSQPPETIAKTLETAITERLHLKSAVVVRTADELAAIANANPIPEAADAGAQLHVMFLAEPTTTNERTALEAGTFEDDVVRPLGREIYVWYRNGMSGSTTAVRLAKLIRTTNTDRNWNTVTKLLTMAK